MWSVFEIQGGIGSMGWFGKLGKRRDHEKGGYAFDKKGD